MVPYRFYGLVRERVTMLEDVYASQFDSTAMSLAADDRAPSADRVFGSQVSPNYFRILGVRAAMGRFFAEADAASADSTPVAVLSHRLWTERLDADPAVIGRRIRLNGRPAIVIGIASPEFQGTSIIAPDLWLPIGVGDARRQPQVLLGGRLKPGATVEQAAAEMKAIGQGLQAEWPIPEQRNSTRGLGLAATSPLPPVFRVPAAAFVTLLTAIVSVVLVIACANVAGVLLARATARRQEIAVRLAIGAGRARLVRQLLTETVLLFALGGAAGVLLARWMTSVLVALLPSASVPVDVSLPLDGRVLLFTAGLSFAAAILSGLVPALQASRADVVTALKSNVHAATDRQRARNVFVVAQVACSLLLIVGAGLLARSLQRVASVDLGFDPRGVEVASLDLSLGGYDETTGAIFARELIERVGRLPGVQNAALAVELPGGGELRMRGGPPRSGAPAGGDPVFEGAWNVIGPGYFSTLRIPLRSGRDFRPGDTAGSTPVAIVSEAAARQLWPGQDPLGRYVALRQFNMIPPAPAVRLLVVGVAADLGSGGPGQPARPLVYRPYQQHYSARVNVLARTTQGQRAAGDIRSAVSALNPWLPIVAARTLDDSASPMLVQLRISAAVSGAVGLVGVLLASIGIYGVTAYAVTRRTREIGVRMALGAQRTDMMRMILRQGMTLVGSGCAIGLLLAAAGTRMLVGLLFGVPALDPVVLAGAAAMFAAIGLAACYVPARRAMRVDVIAALRQH
jgi:predicted permease